MTLPWKGPPDAATITARLAVLAEPGRSTMASVPPQISSLESPLRRKRGIGQFVRFFAVASIVYLLFAYFLLPLGWGGSEKRHPALDDVPRITHTARGIPGDPLNVAFVGSLEELHLAMLESGWFPADPVTLKSSLRIAAGTIFHRTYVDAPVSKLVVWGRRQDLAFEQPAGKDPRRRHHVRFWRAETLDNHGRPLWIGAATFDTRVGLSHTKTPQITHHIDPEIDRERDKLVNDIMRTGNLATVYWVDAFQGKLQGKNGGGDPYRTDGRLEVGVLAVRNRFGTVQLPPRIVPPVVPPVPTVK
jgi:hypothetical protein